MSTEINIVTRGGHPDFLDLPWGQPLEEWETDRLVKMAHGTSRHIVRFVRYEDRVYAIKEIDDVLAEHEYQMLRSLRTEHLPVVEPVGVVNTSGDVGALVTRYLDFSLPYWYLLGDDTPGLSDRLLDAAVVLLVRLHLENYFWGDCSLSNILFRRDAGALMSYLVDAETTEHHPGGMSDGLREHDLIIAQENLIGGLLDLQAGGRRPITADPYDLATDLKDRYDGLWDELTRPDEFDFEERWRIERRVRHINDLGFDVEELAIDRDGSTLKIKPVLIDEGHHSRELRRRTGLEVQENQARRLLADIASHKAWLERETGQSKPAAVAAARWLADVYEPVVESVPDHLLATLEPAEIFHHLLEHRYYLSEQQGREVPHAEAFEDYVVNVLPSHVQERQLTLTPDRDDEQAL